MTTRKIAIRLGVDPADRAEVKRNFNELKAEGVGAFGAVGQSAVAAGRQNDAHTASLKRIVSEAQAVKSALAQRINMTVGIQYEDSAGSARASAMAFEAHFKAQEEGVNRVRAALAANESALNPVATAQNRLNAELAEYAALAKAGRISTDELAASEALARGRFEETRQSIIQRSEAYRTEQAAVQDRLSSAERLRVALAAEEVMLNPLGAARDRLNAELAEYNALAKAGAISTKELAAAEALARKRFDETSAAIQRSGGLSRAHRAGRLNLARQGADVFTTAAMGMDPTMIAIQQGPQILDALSQSGIKVSRSLLLAGGAAAALAAAVGVVGISVLKFIEGQHQSELAVMGVGRAAGLTAAQFNDLAQENSKAANIGISAARSLQVAIIGAGLSSSEMMTRVIEAGKEYGLVIGKDTKTATTELAKALADPEKGARLLAEQFGNLDYETVKTIESLSRQGDRLKAQQLLLEKTEEATRGAADQTFRWGEAMGFLARKSEDAINAIGKEFTMPFSDDPNLVIERYERGGARSLLMGKKGYEEALRRREWDGFFAQGAAAQAEYNKRTIDNGALIESYLPNETKLNKILDERTRIQKDITDGIGDRATNERALAANIKQQEELEKGKIDRREERLVREAAASRVNAEMGWKVVEAMSEGASAMRIAEIRRTAYTEATRKGTDAEAEYRRQLGEFIANEAVNGAKQFASIEERIAVQSRYNGMVAAGSLSRQEANLQAQIELELSDLAIARDQASGAEKEKLTKIYDALKAARERDNDEQVRGQIIDATRANNDEISFLEKQLSFVRLTNDERAIALAHEQALRDLEKMDPNMSPEERAAFIKSAEGKAVADNNLRRGEYLENMKRADQRDMEMSQRLLEVAHLTDKERDKALRKLQREQDLKEAGLKAGTEEYELALRRLQLSDELAESADRQVEYFDKIRAMQEGAIDRFAGLMTEGNYNLKDWRDTAIDAIQDVIAEAILLSTINPFKNWLLGTDHPTTGNGGLLGMLGDLMSTGGKSSSFAPDQRGDIASTIIKWGGSIFGGFRANGGPIDPGKAYVVGENGPEFFMAMERGLIVPNHQISAAPDPMQRVRKAVNAPSQPIVQQHYHLHAENAVMTPELMADLSKQADDISKKNIRQGLKEYSKTTPDQVASFEARPRWRKG